MTVFNVLESNIFLDDCNVKSTEEEMVCTSIILDRNQLIETSIKSGQDQLCLSLSPERKTQISSHCLPQMVMVPSTSKRRIQS